MHQCFFSCWTFKPLGYDVILTGFSPLTHGDLLTVLFPLVNVNKNPWKDPPFYSWVVINSFDWASFNSYFDITRG